MLRSLGVLLLSLCAVCSLFSWSCRAVNEQRELELFTQFQELRQQGRRLQCDLEKLGMESRILWDSVAHQLQEGIPPEVPEQERRNMIGVRNAGLIRMFEAYPQLPPAIHATVDQAESRDQAIAKRMRLLDADIRQHDRHVTLFLEQAQQAELDSLSSWKRQLVEQVCN